MSVIAHEREELVKGCLQARDRSYCPYSRFPVGAAVLVTKENGKIREIFVGEPGPRLHVPNFSLFLTSPYALQEAAWTMQCILCLPVRSASLLLRQPVRGSNSCWLLLLHRRSLDY